MFDRPAFGATIVAETRPTAVLRQVPESPRQTANIIRNLVFCELMPDAVSISEHNFPKYLQGRPEMDNQRHRYEFELRQTYDQFVTDSIILSDEFVESSLAGNRSDDRNPHRASQGILNGLILSTLLWVLFLLPFLVF